MNKSLIYTALLILVCSTCRKEEESLPPQAVIVSNLVSGKTTDQFEFSADSSQNPNHGSVLYYRWDFGTDEGWANLPSKNPRVTHRYFTPGHYQVKLEVVNSEGLADTTSLNILVEQGHSPPRAQFRVYPENGHIFTEYLFDASLTHDDEDSLATLLFRWDFNGDAIWDTELTPSPQANYVFGQQNKYDVLLQVKDPSGLTSFLKKELKVGLTDYDLLAGFTWTPEDGTEQDTFLFDASQSHHPAYPDMKLTYQWQLEEGEGWTQISEEPTIAHRFRTIRTQLVRLRVTEPNGLYNTATNEIHLNAANKPPDAHYILSIPRGNIRTQFFFSAWTSVDQETLPTSLQVRWDFEGDGNWDTPYSTEKKVWHQYEQAGTYNPILEVLDAGGLTDQYQEEVYVSPYTNETGMVIDGRDGEIYGTVKIGDRWWFAENVRYEVSRKQYFDDRGFLFWSPWEPWKCLDENPLNCDLYGKYYHISSAVDNTHIMGEISSGDEVIYQICPRGWRIPYEEDLRQLVAQVGQNGAHRLMTGGDTDFNLQYLGYADWYILWEEMMVPQDTVYVFKETYQSAWLFSQSEPAHELRTDFYMLKISRNSDEILEGYENARFFVPVRCVKDE